MSLEKVSSVRELVLFKTTKPRKMFSLGKLKRDNCNKFPDSEHD